MAMTRRGVLAAAGLGGAAYLLSACSTDPDSAEAVPEGVDTINYVTGFGNSIREAYALVANKTGIAESHGVHFKVEYGESGSNNFTLLNAGQVDMMATDSSGAFTMFVDGQEQGFQVLAAVQNVWPMAVVGFADTFTSPRDLNGATIGIADGTLPQRLWPAYVEATSGVSLDQVEVIATNPADQNNQLINGQLDGIVLFSVAEPGLSARAGGRETISLPWTDVFPDFHGNCLVASRRLLDADPDLARRGMQALLDGLAYMLDHPEEAAELWTEDYPEFDAETSAAELRLMAEFCYGKLGDRPLGHLDPDRVVQQMGMLTALGEITGDFNAALPGPDDPPDFGVVNFAMTPGGGDDIDGEDS